MLRRAFGQVRRALQRYRDLRPWQPGEVLKDLFGDPRRITPNLEGVLLFAYSSPSTAVILLCLALPGAFQENCKAFTVKCFRMNRAEKLQAISVICTVLHYPNRMSRAPNQSPLPAQHSSVDVLIITALPVERDALLALQEPYRKIQQPHAPTYYHATVPAYAHEGEYTVVVTMLSQMGNVPAAQRSNCVEATLFR